MFNQSRRMSSNVELTDLAFRFLQVQRQDGTYSLLDKATKKERSRPSGNQKYNEVSRSKINR